DQFTADISAATCCAGTRSAAKAPEASSANAPAAARNFIILGEPLRFVITHNLRYGTIAGQKKPQFRPVFPRLHLFCNSLGSTDKMLGRRASPSKAFRPKTR